ncbi:opioid growth factor receptor-like protein 1 [Ruditapes philippinarum]|uniref:opioid growth factor receptor-like protein 1 n=1 Tax=Ruditapes philippinarum TaxID=129788 RepID=UPI00295BD636|nr:opioid growth factor receptor-like protein 1 [Ruditapes philippinarum]
MIEDMLKWKGNYEMLEKNQNYIQWLFPVPDNNSINTNAQQLFEHEAKLIREDDGAQRRVLKAFMMMLDFYGMKLKDSKHGLVTRADIGWQDRYDHLNRSRHNLSRITRILKSLGELGYERYQARWVEFIIDEAKIKGLLPNLNGPCLMHWVITVKDDREREMLYRKAVGSDIDENEAQSVWKSEGERNENGGDLKAERTNLSIETNLSSKVNHGKAVTEKKDDLQRKMCESKATYSHIDTSVDSTTSSLSSKLQIVKPLLGAKPSMERPNKQQVTDDYEKGSDEVSLNYKETYQYHNQEREASDNLKFYQNKKLSRPNPGYTIETMLHCKGDHLFFEMYPGFIHWLFPIPSSVGVNEEVQVLHNHEAKAIREDSVLSSRVYDAFDVLLDFYGMELYNDIKGKFKRKKRTYKERYDYLQSYPLESYRRITRVLVSIGELGLERFQVPWIEFLIKEGIENELFPTLDGQSIMHWIASIKDEEERQEMFRKYQKLAGHRPTVTWNVDEHRPNDYDTNLRSHGNATRYYIEAEGGFH